MRASILPFFLLIIALDALPAVFVVVRILRRAAAAGVPAGWHVGFALFGGVIAGMVTNGLAVQYFLLHAQAWGAVPTRWQVVIVILGGMAGSAVAAGAVYLQLRMKIQRDPDYEDPHPASDVHPIDRPEG